MMRAIISKCKLSTKKPISQINSDESDIKPFNSEAKNWCMILHKFSVQNTLHRTNHYRIYEQLMGLLISLCHSYEN